MLKFVKSLIGSDAAAAAPVADANAVHKILTHLRANVTETASTAAFVTSYGDDGKLVLLHSDR